MQSSARFSFALFLAVVFGACAGVVDAPAPHETDESASTSVLDIEPATQSTAAAGPRGRVLNTGWVGGACTSAAECNSASFTRAATCETDGFPDGHCTQACVQGSSGNWSCPDTTMTGTDATTTRCVSDDEGAPRCASACDFAKSPETGCRPGYGCVLRQKHGTHTPDQIFPMCLPLETQRWPGEAAPANDIGAACENATDCASKACMKLANGSCTKYLCDLTGCPEGSTCVRLGKKGETTACVKDCAAPDDCRVDEGYTCVGGNLNVCWYDRTPVAHDTTQAVADCAEAWGQAGSGLHVCDTTPDRYLVLRKAARNLSLCERGALVRTYYTGLGFTPRGDKAVEGDGKTPEGVFYIPRLIPASEYRRAFLLSYPDNGDADRGLERGLISTAQANAIRSAQASCNEPPQNTALGGLVEVHGAMEPGAGDWTWGCISVTDAEVETLWAALGQSDTIVVKP